MRLPYVTRPAKNARRHSCGCIDIPDNYRPGKFRASLLCRSHRGGHAMERAA